MPPVSKKNSHGQDNGQDYGHNGLDYDPKVAGKYRVLLEFCLLPSSQYHTYSRMI